MSAEEPESKAVELIGIASSLCEFFSDQHGTPYAFTKNPGRVMQLGAREFKVWLVKQFFDLHNQAVGSDAINAALNVLEAKAAGGDRIVLSTRCSMDGAKLIVDMANKSEESVVIDAQGWSIQQLTVPRFRRYSHMLPLVIGPEAGDLREFARFWRLKDPADDILLVATLGLAFVSEIPRAILTVVGPKGSTKSTMTRAFRQFVDPSSIEDMTIAEKGKEFAQQLAHHYVPLFDNVSRLQTWQSDDLCRATTGAGFTKRALYTDDDDVVFRIKRFVIINGINTPTQRGDYLDRALLLECARVPRGERLEDAEVRARVDAWLPGLRKTTFDALSKAISLLGQVRGELQELPRMADFCIWGEAFCRALGYEPLAFYDRYMQRVNDTSSIALENDVIAELLFKLFEDERSHQYLTGKDEFEGTASTLLKVLQNLNDDLKYVSAKELPASPETLSRHLGELAADLEETGLKIVRKKTTGGKRSLVVQRVPPRGSKTAPLLPLAPLQTTSNDGQSGASGASGENVISSMGDGT